MALKVKLAIKDIITTLDNDPYLERRDKLNTSDLFRTLIDIKRVIPSSVESIDYFNDLLSDSFDSGLSQQTSERLIALLEHTLYIWDQISSEFNEDPIVELTHSFSRIKTN